MSTPAAAWCRIDDSMASRLDADAPSPGETLGATELFKVLGDPTRMRLLSLLRSEPLCVHDLSRLLSMSQTAVSHQLKVLRHTKLVKFHREGRMTIYELDDEHVAMLLDIAQEHVKEAYHA